MADSEPVGITVARLDRIPDPWKETFTPNDLPSRASILNDIYQKDPRDTKSSEIVRARQHEDFIGLTDQELDLKVPALVDACLAEMLEYETVAREPAEKRLAKLRQVAPSVTRVIDRSAPGDYYHLNKDDKYKHDPSMQGGDRVRSDQSAILAIVLSGIKENWPDSELLLFLNQHILGNNNEGLNKLREKAKGAVRNSGIRLAYSGQEDEVKAIQTVLDQKNVFIPKECVDFVGPEGIVDTLAQTKRFKEYLENNLKPGDAFVEAINLQGIRASRMAQMFGMVPPNTNYLIYAMPTIKDNMSSKYRKDEIQGTVFYALTAKASFDPAPHQII